ncbi:MAG: sensor histidine kinase [Chloroflexi bacterium]|nr:sensor histidine kinase [Chloroflexota bacterium]
MGIFGLRVGRIGIQKRFMLYVAAGLAMLFSGFAFFGLTSIRQSTDLVYEERLNTASTTAGTLESDFLDVLKGVREFSAGVMAQAEEPVVSGTRRLLEHLSGADLSRFFLVTGVWVLDSQGGLVAQAGSPSWTTNGEGGALVESVAKKPEAGYVLSPAQLRTADEMPFVTLAMRVGDQYGPESRVVAVHTASKNSSAPYVPTTFWQAGEVDARSSEINDPKSVYHLEVVSPAGITVLAIGPGESPGHLSVHLPSLRDAERTGKPAVMLHKPLPGDAFRPHVIAMAPLKSSGFYLLLEQRADVALALPLALQRQLAIMIILGFPASLLVAWRATRRVVKPIQQLTLAAERMAEGNLCSPINVEAQDEVADLTQGLEATRRKLMAASQHIESINRELESKVKERTARLGEVLQKVMSAQEEERHRLARELHDEQCQTLGTICVSLDRLSRLLCTAPPQVQEEVGQARRMALSLLNETRRLIYDLRPSVLDDMGLEAAIRWSAEVHLTSHSIEATIESSLPPRLADPATEVALFRIAQEAIVNIERHAKAHRAGIVLEQHHSSVKMQVWDDGQGFDVSRSATPQETSGAGLEGMQERVRLLGGRMEIVSAPGRGTTVKVEVPQDEGEKAL